MSGLEYISTNTIPKEKVYGTINKCKKCPYITKSLFFIKNHVKSRSSADPLVWFDCFENNLECFICRECNFTTYLVTEFREHVKNHNVKSEYTERSSQIKNEDALKVINEISICDDYECKSFTEEYTKSKHASFMRQNEENNNSSDNITFNFKSKRSLRGQHCDHCLFKDKSKYNLQNHFECRHNMSVHLVNKNTLPEDIEWLDCDHCSFKAKNKYRLDEHKRRRHSLGYIVWLQCDKCSYKTKLKCNLEEHTAYHHAPEKIKWIQCDQCTRKYKREDSLQKHIRTNHIPGNISWFHCDHCSFKTKQKSYFRQHVIIHQRPPVQIKWFQCDHCSFQSKCKDNLREHISRIHICSPF